MPSAHRCRRLLDEAGWKPGADGVRTKDGRKLELLMYSYNVGRNPKLSEIMQAAAHSRLFLAGKKRIKDVRSHGIYSAALYKGLDVRP
jgi:hypothetical protein